MPRNLFAFLFRVPLITLIAVIVVVLFPIKAQASYPLVRNFLKADYAAGSQNWAAAQLPSGVMLFGNQYGMLSFDSRQWNLYGINYGSAVRAIYVDSISQRVYVGGSNEFGYFEDDSALDRPVYRSLRATVDTSEEFHEFWNIFRIESDIWLCEDFSVLRFDGRETRVVAHFDSKITQSSAHGRALYLGFENGDLCIVDAPSGNFSFISTPFSSRICGITQIKDALYIVTAIDGVFTLEQDGSIAPALTSIKPFLAEYRAFCAAASGDFLAIGTVRGGVIVCNVTTGANMYANSNTGLQNNTVLAAAFDREDNLWLGLDNGLACVFTDSPIHTLLGRVSDYGAGYASLLDGNRLLLGTNQGLFSTPYPIQDSPVPGSLRRLLTGQIWNLSRIDGSTFVCSDEGLFIGDGANFYKVSGVPAATSAIPLAANPDLALVSSYYGFYLIRHTSGRWISLGKVDGFDFGGMPVQDSRGDLWLVHWQHGVYRLRLDADDNRFVVAKLYSTGEGLPAPTGNTVQIIGSELVFSTVDGIYRYDPDTDSIVKQNTHDSYFANLGTSRIFEAPGANLWVVSDHSTDVVSSNLASGIRVDSVTYRLLSSSLIYGYENFYFLDENSLLVNNEYGFYFVDTNHSDTHTNANPILISSVYTANDSLLYAAQLFPQTLPKLRLPYTLNSLRFDYVLPQFVERNDVLYSVALRKANGSEISASRFSTATSKEYTNLVEGDYVFVVHALDPLRGSVEECTVDFAILPPWYRSVWAYTAYLFLALIILLILFKVYVSRSNKAARDMERRKDAELRRVEEKNREETMRKDFEIAQLKARQLEHEIRDKSNELSNSTLNLLRKNELLHEITERLSKLEKSIPQVESNPKIIAMLAKIKQLIRENISHDDDWKTFTRNFDVVYDNYLKRLCAAHPKLTVTEQRLCAYIKMGLSSKEIAPLLNITFRSVEMGRYRLRKKMELPQDISLAEYLTNF